MATCKSSVTSLILAAVAGGIFALVGAQALSQNTTKDMKDAGKQAIKDVKDAAKNAGDKAKEAMGMPEGMPPEMQKYMQNMMECGTPGPVHAEMAKMVGTWKCDSQMWMMPGGPAEASTGTMTYKSIFGGRALQGDFEGSYKMGDQTVSMQGMELTGYDNWTGKSWSFWMGDSCTSPWFAQGNHDSAAKSCAMEGTTPNFYGTKGSTVKTRSLMTMTSDTTAKFEMWTAGPDGKEFKHMEMMMTKK
jgi:hypothetical protein